MIRYFVVPFLITVALLALVACIIVPTVTPTQSPLPTATLSPFAKPQVGFVEYEPIETKEDNIMSAEILLSIFSAGLSLLVAYVPGFKSWYEKYDDTQKRGLMAIGLVIITAAFFGLSCAGWVNIGLTCDEKSVIELVKMFFLALGVNQGMHWARPKK